jgi:hypothetical protein
MKNLLIFFFALFAHTGGEPKFIYANKAKKSKVDFSSKYKSCNVHYFAMPIGTVLNLLALQFYIQRISS